MNSTDALCEFPPEMDERDLQWVRSLLGMFPPDALERLTRAEYDYYSTHGDYLPGLARLALYYREKLARAAFIAEHLMLMIDPRTANGSAATVAPTTGQRAITARSAASNAAATRVSQALRSG